MRKPRNLRGRCASRFGVLQDKGDLLVVKRRYDMAAVTNDTPRWSSPWPGPNVGSRIAQHIDARRGKAGEFHGADAAEAASRR